MKLLSSLPKRFWISVTTLTIIGMLFFYYLFVYVQDHEEILRDQKYKALARYGENMLKSKFDHEQAIYRVVTDTIDSLTKRHVTCAKAVVNSIRKCFLQLNEQGIVNSFQVIKQKDLDTILHRRSDSIHFQFSFDKLMILFSKPAKRFIYKPQEFDEFFVIRKTVDRFHKNVEDEKEKEAPYIIFQTLENNIELTNLGSFMSNERGLLTGRFSEVTLADVTYKIFTHSMEFSGEQNQMIGDNWILCGLIRKDNYEATARSVDPFIITGAILIVLLLVVSMPLLRLLMMNTYDQLGLLNVILVGFSIVAGTTIFFLCLWSASHYVQSGDEVDEKIAGLSNQVKQRFQDELVKINGQLTEFSTKVDSIEKLPRDTLISDYRSGGVYPHFNYAMWANSAGRSVFTRTTKHLGVKPVIQRRQYFSRVIHDSLWYLPGRTAHSSAFALQSIISWADHTIEAGMGIRASYDSKDTIKVIAISTRLHSIMGPALPLGYSFCIVDDTGEVWFHSDSTKNHQQNVLYEINPHNPLRIAMDGRIKGSFSGQYSSKRGLIYVQPIDDIPLFLIVFSDHDNQTTPVVLTILFVLILVAILLGTQAILLAILYACRYKSTKLHGTSFWLDVLSPYQKDPARYEAGVRIQLVLIGIVVVLYFIGSREALAVSLITLPILLMIFHQEISLHQWMNGKRYFVFVALSLIALILIDATAFEYVDSNAFQESIFYQVLFGAVLLQGDFLKGIRKLNFKSYPLNYHCYLMCWLILVSVLPVSVFYGVAYENESIMWTQYKLLMDSKAIEARTMRVDRIFSSEHDKRSPRDRSYVHTIGNYIPMTPRKSGTSKLSNALTVNNKLQESLFESLPKLPSSIGASVKVVQAADDKKSNKKWMWAKLKDNETIQIQYTPEFSHKGNRRAISLQDTIPQFHFSYIWLAIILPIALYGLYRVIRFSTKYVFGLDVSDASGYSPKQINDIINDNTSVKELFIVGLPGCGKEEVISNNTSRVNSGEIIADFEFGLNDPATLQRVLNYIYDRQNKHLATCIFSAVSPTVLFDIYSRKISALQSAAQENKDDKGETDNKITEYKVALRKWKYLLSGFDVHYLSIKPKCQAPKNSELRCSRYLAKLSIPDQKNPGDKDYEDFILDLDKRATLYYTSLWNSFSEEEKLFLFDLARDGFANFKNHSVITGLMKKGVVVKNDRPAIMNTSFTNFILDTFREDEEIELTKVAQKKSTWHSFSLTLILVIVGGLVFIALAQKDLMTNLNAFVVALTSALTFFTKFGDIFGSGSRSK